jgi:hypothetical protein
VLNGVGLFRYIHRDVVERSRGKRYGQRYSIGGHFDGDVRRKQQLRWKLVERGALAYETISEG